MDKGIRVKMIRGVSLEQAVIDTNEFLSGTWRRCQPLSVEYAGYEQSRHGFVIVYRIIDPGEQPDHQEI